MPTVRISRCVLTSKAGSRWKIVTTLTYELTGLGLIRLHVRADEKPQPDY